MDSDRVEGKAKETEGEVQQKWGEAKDKARDAWEDVKDKAEDVVDGAEDRVDELDEKNDEPARSSASPLARTSPRTRGRLVRPLVAVRLPRRIGGYRHSVARVVVVSSSQIERKLCPTWSRQMTSSTSSCRRSSSRACNGSRTTSRRRARKGSRSASPSARGAGEPSSVDVKPDSPRSGRARRDRRAPPRSHRGRAPRRRGGDLARGGRARRASARDRRHSRRSDKHLAGGSRPPNRIDPAGVGSLSARVAEPAEDGEDEQHDDENEQPGRHQFLLLRWNVIPRSSRRR